MNRKRFIYVLAGFFVLFFTATLSADDIRAVQERVKERLGAIDQLKSSQLVGENNKGFLEARGNLKPDQRQLMDAENQDRKALYAAVAKRAGQSPSTVGSQRALRIARLASGGIWLQRPSGEWYQK